MTMSAQDSTATPAPTEEPTPTPPPAEEPQPIPTPPVNSETTNQNTPTPAANNPTPTNNNATRPSNPTPTPTNNPVSSPTNTRPATPEPEEEPEIEQQVDLNNPFELVDYGNKRPKEETTEGATAEVLSPRDTSIHYNNPFELVENGRLAMLTTSSETTTTTSKKGKKKTKKKKRRVKKTEPIFDNSKLDLNAVIKFLVLLVIGLFLAFLNTSYQRDIQKIYRAFTNNNLMMQLYREKGSLLDMPYIPLYMLFCFTGGAFIFLILDYYKISLLNSPILSILACMSGLAGFYLIKHLILKMISGIFPFKKEIHEYHFTLGVFNQIIGLALIPFVTIVAFAPQNIKLFAIYAAYLVIAIILTQRLFRSILISQKFIAFHNFHFIVYLCTVEIAPIFIILKLIIG